MTPAAVQREMLKRVAEALGNSLCQEVVFAGGCATGLLVTDSLALEQVRHTDDVDLIVSLMSYASYQDLLQRLRKRGFREFGPASEVNVPICALRLGSLRVDLMPDALSILGFSNRWYEAAVATAQSYRLTSATEIRLISPVYFLATKFEALADRGAKNLLASTDAEDILNLLNGRDAVWDEIEAAEPEVRGYLAGALRRFMNHRDFDNLLQSSCESDERAQWLYAQLEGLLGRI